ncbi:MAG: HTTM domain-containing protein, partial [Granulosicoccus sp.]|nr:HTTM domain-containing protein [Granulosicoccus sp.]
MLNRIIQQMFCPVDAAFLAVFRIGFGAILLFESVNYGLFLCLECFYHSSDLLFKYRHFSWVNAAPTVWLRTIWLLMAVLAIMVMLGFYYRAAMLLYTVGFTYHFLLEQVLYLNHFYLVILLCGLMTLVPAHAYWSLDAKRSSAIASDTVPYWSKFVLAAQLEIVLIYAGLVKLNADWLALEPMRMWMNYRSHDEIALFQWLTQDWGIAVASYGVIALHLIGAPLLLYRKTRLPVLFCYAFFHTINMFVFNIGIFPWMTLFASLLFFDADWPRQFAAWLSQKRIFTGLMGSWLMSIGRSAGT